MRLVNDSKAALAANLSRLLETRPDLSRLDLSRQMGVSDGSLGRIKYGTGNPTVEVLDQIANFFKISTPELLSPQTQKSAQRAQGFDPTLLTWAVTTAMGAYRKARIAPSDEQIAAAVTFVYGHAAAGKDLKEVAKSVDTELRRLLQTAKA